jgi:hypothetical protein
MGQTVLMIAFLWPWIAEINIDAVYTVVLTEDIAYPFDVVTH